MPLAPTSAFKLWHNIRRPAIAAAWECCPSLPRMAAVEDVTKKHPLPFWSIPGIAACAARKSPRQAIRQPSSNCFREVSAKLLVPIWAPRLKMTTSIAPSFSLSATKVSMTPTSTALAKRPDAVPPCCWISWIKRSKPCWSDLRDRTTWYPPAAKRLATHPPIPAPAPMIKQTGFIWTTCLHPWSERAKRENQNCVYLDSFQFGANFDIWRWHLQKRFCSLRNFCFDPIVATGRSN